MYDTLIQEPDKALSHLFLHCCFKDGKFTEAEIDDISAKFVALSLHKDLNFKQELQEYRTYKDLIDNETSYLQHLIKLINPTNEAALYSYCLELALSDASLDVSEKKLFDTLGTILELTGEEQNTIQKLMVQRKVVETNRFF